jgi:hypothetical protein
LEYDPKGAGYTFPIATQARLDKENKIQPWRNSLAVSLNQNAELPHETIIPNANDCNPSWGKQRAMGGNGAPRFGGRSTAARDRNSWNARI